MQEDDQSKNPFTAPAEPPQAGAPSSPSPGRGGSADTTGGEGLDRLVRQALEPAASSVARCVTRALGHSRPGRRRSVGGWLSMAAAAAAVVLAVALFWSPAGDRRPQAGDAASTQKLGPVEPGPPEVLTLTNPQGVLTVESPSGVRLIVLSGDKS